jgi:hypothetical protein
MSEYTASERHPKSDDNSAKALQVIQRQEDVPFSPNNSSPLTRLQSVSVPVVNLSHNDVLVPTPPKFQRQASSFKLQGRRATVCLCLDLASKLSEDKWHVCRPL